MEAQLSAMEKTIETSELLEVIVETEAEAGVSGMSVAGGGKGGIFVKDVLKDSPAARVLSLQEGDQLLSARVYFDNIKFEDALQILRCAKPYKISFCLKRTVPSRDVSRQPGAPTFEVRGPKAKVAKLNIQSLSVLKTKTKKKKKKGLAKDLREAEGRGSHGDLAAGKLDLAPVDVEFSLPKFSKLRKARSAGEVAAAEPSPDRSPHLSSLETKRRRLKFPRLKVKEAAAAAVGARAEGARGRLGAGLLPKMAMELKAGAKGEAEGKVPRFTVPFSKARKAKEEAAAAKADAGFQAPQVELDLPPLPKVGARAESPKASAKGEGFRLQPPQFGLPKVETVLPKVSSVGLEVPEGSIRAGLKLPVAEVVAPKLDVDLSLPKLEGAAPEVAPKGEGFRIKVPKFGVSAEEAELKLSSVKAPTLEVTLGKGRARAEESEEKLKPGVTMPALDVEAPSVDLEFPLPTGKEEVAAPVVSAKIPSVSQPRLGSRAPEEGGSRLPQVELSVGKPESPKLKARGPTIQIPGLGLSLMDHKLESKEGAVESKAKFPGVKVPSLDLSLPKAGDLQRPAVAGEPLAPARRVKSEEAAEGAGFKFQMPQVSLPKFDLPAKATPSPPQVRAKSPKPEGDSGTKVGVPEVALPLLSVKVPDVQLPRVPLQKPELSLSVETPEVELALPSARLSSPSAAAPTLKIDLPKVGVELDLPKVGRDPALSEQPLPDHEATLRLPTLETISKGLGVEICVPTCQVDQPEPEPSGRRVFEGPDVGGMVARVPKVDLALGKELEVAEWEPGTEVSLGLRGKALLKAGLGLEGSAVGPKAKLPSVEIPAVKLPDMTVESGKRLEAESKLKSTKFALPKFSISGPKVRKASPEAPRAEGPEAADKGSKLKMPKFGISFPKSKWGAEGDVPKLGLSIEGRTAQEASGVASEPQVGVDSSESRMKLPTVDVEMPTVAVGIALPKGSGEEAAGTSPEVGVDLPDIQLRVPKFSLPKFGGKGKESDAEGRELGLKGAKAKASKFKMPSFGVMRRDGEASGLGAEAKAKQGPGSPREKPQGPFGKVPKLTMSSPTVAEADKGQLSLQPPELDVKIPQVELLKVSTKEARVEEGLLTGAESPGLKAKMPSLEIAMPGPGAGGEKPVVDVSEADIRRYEGELKIPKVPSVAVSAPRVELGISLPTTGAEEPGPHGTPSAEAKIRLPKVELPKFGRGEEDRAEAAVQLLGRRLSLGREGESGAEGAAEASLLGAKIRVPKVDLSLPKARLSDAELPLTGAGEVAGTGLEGKFKMPSFGLPKFSAPKMRAPDVSRMPKVTVSGPAIKLPKFGGSGSDGEGEAEADLPRVPQLELKAPKLRGSLEVLSPETGAKEAKIKMPSLPLGFGLGKPDLESGAGADEGKFKLKLPSVSISKAGTEASADTQPLCPPAEGADFSFRMPQIALPDVGFSVDQEGKSEAKGEAGKLAGVADLEVGGGGLRMPKGKGPASGGSGPKGDVRDADLEGRKLAFELPGVELSPPGLKAHAEYEVEGAQPRHGGSQEPEGAGRRGVDGRKSPGGKGQAADGDAGKKYKVKLPKFGLSLPKVGLEAGEGLPGQEAEAKGKRPAFALSRPKGKGAEGSSGLLEGEAEADSRGGMMARLKLRPAFGLSLSKPRTGVEVNGEPEGPSSSSSKLKVPQLGFSAANGEGAEASPQNGSAQDSKGKLGMIRLPQVELSSPSKAPEADSELNLQLVRAEEAEAAVAQGGLGAFTALKAAKFRSPKISLSGFKKRNGEAEAPGAMVSSAARTEMASLESAKGEKSPKFRFPKLALSPKAHGVLEISSEHPEDEGGLKIKLPTVGFSGEVSSEEQVLEAVGSPGRVA
ncbi:periaxin [Elgaria multicarinata webbii]|uniref:periaxin n=1 Tax=Elgaria multicarinata webbii TaxID=159646 RepID=UPI002FCD469C